MGHALMEALAVGLDLPRKHFETNNITRDSYWGLRVRDIGAAPQSLGLLLQCADKCRGGVGAEKA